MTGLFDPAAGLQPGPGVPVALHAGVKTDAPFVKPLA